MTRITGQERVGDAERALAEIVGSTDPTITASWRTPAAWT